MKYLSFQSFSAFLRETFAILLHALRGLRTLNWLQLLLLCVGLSVVIALVIAIVPLALGLFVLALLAKFIMGLFAPRTKEVEPFTIENGEQP